MGTTEQAVYIASLPRGVSRISYILHKPRLGRGGRLRTRPKCILIQPNDRICPNAASLLDDMVVSKHWGKAPFDFGSISGPLMCGAQRVSHSATWALPRPEPKSADCSEARLGLWAPEASNPEL